MRGRLWFLCGFCLLLLAASGYGPVQAAGVRQAAPDRILSMNLCIDELLIRLVGKDRIVSVAADSADPRVSSIVEEVAGIPVNRGRAEEVIAFEPDLVLAGPFTTPHTTDILRRLGFRVETVPLPTSFAQAATVIRNLAGLLGVPERGDILAAELLSSLAELRSDVSGAARRPLAAFFEPNGFTPTAGTIGDRLLAAAGLRNLADDLAKPYLSLEDLIAAEPDFLVLQARPGRTQSQAEALLDHPAMRTLKERSRILRLPSLAWACGGPQSLEAAEVLASQVRALR